MSFWQQASRSWTDRIPHRKCHSVLLWSFGYLFLNILGSAALPGQALGPDPEHLAFDSPESWAMKYFAAVTLPMPFGGARELETGQLEMALEVSEIPFLNEDERRVGFGGAKVEDLNHSSLVVRPFLSMGLPTGFNGVVSAVPKTKIEGVYTQMYSLQVHREVLQFGEFRLVVGGVWSYTETSGAFTASQDLVDAGLDPLRAVPPSNDTSYLRVLGLTASLAWEPQALSGFRFFIEGSALRLNNDFQTDVTVFDGDLRDQRTLKAEGRQETLQLGVEKRLNSKLSIAGSLHYAPLDVVRVESRGSEEDSLVQFRSFIRYRF